MPVMKTCEACGYTWDPNPWRKCPRCAGSSKAYEPSLEEIRTACAMIQSRWSPAEKRRRRNGVPTEVGVTMATLVHCLEGE